MTKLTEGVSRRAVKCEPSTPRPAPPPATIANKAHVFTEDQNTMEWYIDGIPVAELKRRYEAHDALVKALREARECLDCSLSSSQYRAISGRINSALHAAEVRNG